jgi:hypothetical protein
MTANEPSQAFDRVLDIVAQKDKQGIVIVSPLVVVEAKGVDMWITYLTVNATRRKNRKKCHFTAQVQYGPCKTSVPDWANAFDTIITLDHAGALSKAEAEIMHQDLIKATGRRFRKVLTCETELRAVQMIDGLWPSEQSSKLLVAVKAENVYTQEMSP